VDHFGQRKFDIACVGSWYGTRENPELQDVPRDLVVSGGLFAFLYNAGVKGLVMPDEGVFSARGDSPLEKKRRFAELTSGKQDKILRKKMWWQKEKE